MNKLSAINAGGTRFIFVTGGVLSGLGKGITAASIGATLKARGLNVNIQKCDPYLNVDAGTLNPREHGECFVTFDGAETDLDLGHYERFLDQNLNTLSSVMSGKILLKVITDERAGRYKGEDVQIIPHFTAAIQEYILEASKDYDVHIVEIGGTVGDYESLAFIEAIREFSIRVGVKNCIFTHLVYLPYLNASRETKTKPAQNSVKELRGLGISPDILVARSENEAHKSVKSKLSLFSGVDEEAILLLPNADTIYRVPLTIERAGITDLICQKLNLKPRVNDMNKWKTILKGFTAKYDQSIKIGIIAKYLDNQDTYMSVFEALRAAAVHNKCAVEIEWVDSEALEKLNPNGISDTLAQYDGIIVPGGFGTRGLEGKICAATFALKTKKPYLGLCLGLQMAVVAAARLAGLKDATSQELDSKSAHQVIKTMLGQQKLIGTGGTLRLGDYDCRIQTDSLAFEVFKTDLITERHRHRFECNNDYRTKYAEWGIRDSGQSPNGELVEIIEAIDHPFFIAIQSHPELISRPNRPHPLFDGLIIAALKNKIT